jgi:hypothetical protein
VTVSSEARESDSCNFDWVAKLGGVSNLYFPAALSSTATLL